MLKLGVKLKLSLHDIWMKTGDSFGTSLSLSVWLRKPLLEESMDLLKLDTRDILDAAVASSVYQALEVGKKQYQPRLLTTTV